MFEAAVDGLGGSARGPVSVEVGQVFKTWLSEREESWRQGVEVVAMDGFSGFKTATSEELPDAVAVMGRDSPSTWSGWPATPWTGVDAGSS